MLNKIIKSGLLCLNFLAISQTAFAEAKYSTQIVPDFDHQTSERPHIYSTKTLLSPQHGQSFTHQTYILLAQPNSKGVSLSHFKEFGFDNLVGEIFVKNPANGQMISQTIAYPAEIQVMPRDNTKLAIFKVTGDKGSYMRGDIKNTDINQKTDVIFSNPNGYTMHGKFDGFGDVSFTTDAVKLDASGNLKYSEYKFNNGPDFFVNQLSIGTAPTTYLANDFGAELNKIHNNRYRVILDKDGFISSK